MATPLTEDNNGTWFTLANAPILSEVAQMLPYLEGGCLAFSLLSIQLLNTAVPADLLRRWVNRWAPRFWRLSSSALKAEDLSIISGRLFSFVSEINEAWNNLRQDWKSTLHPKIRAARKNGWEAVSTSAHFWQDGECDHWYLTEHLFLPDLVFDSGTGVRRERWPYHIALLLIMFKDASKVRGWKAQNAYPTTPALSAELYRQKQIKWQEVQLHLYVAWFHTPTK